VASGDPAALAAMAAQHPGTHLASRDVANAEAAQATAQNDFGDNLIFGVIATLAAVSLVNTLVVATAGRREALRLLGRVGATRGQAAAVFGWQALFVTVTGLAAGVTAGAVTLLTVTKAATGSWAPFIRPGAVVLVTGVTVLVAAAIMIPFRLMSRREPGLG